MKTFVRSDLVGELLGVFPPEQETRYRKCAAQIDASGRQTRILAVDPL